MISTNNRETQTPSIRMDFKVGLNFSLFLSCYAKKTLLLLVFANVAP